MDIFDGSDFYYAIIQDQSIEVWLLLKIIFEIHDKESRHQQDGGKGYI